MSQSSMLAIALWKLPLYVQGGRVLHGVIVKAMNYGIVVSKFEFHLRYYVLFWANTLGKGMNPLILPAMS